MWNFFYKERCMISMMYVFTSSFASNSPLIQWLYRPYVFRPRSEGQISCFSAEIGRRSANFCFEVEQEKL